MTHRPCPKLLIVLSSTRARAVEVAARNGVEPHEVVWPKSLTDLLGYDDLPLYADQSLWSHPAGYDLAGYFAARVIAGERRRARSTWLARAHG